jgi:hypothetical protein
MGSEARAQHVKGDALQACLLNDPVHGVNEFIEIPLREPFPDRCRALRSEAVSIPTSKRKPL